MTIAAPLELHRDTVISEWIDYNGHMNVAYYVLIFDYATDKFLDFVGLDQAYRSSTNCSTFAVEAHVTYQKELAEGDPVRITTQLLGHDRKGIHFVHQMYHAEKDFLAATSEWLNLHVDMERRRVSSFPTSIKERLSEIMAAHRDMEAPAPVGRVIRPFGSPRGN